MSLEIYINEDLTEIRDDLRKMCVSHNVIEYVESCCRLAYAIGARDGLKEGRSISIAKDQQRLLAANGEEC